jgi:hypothetical protein
MNDPALSELQSGSENADYLATPFLYIVAKVDSGDTRLATDAVVAGTHLDLLENREPGWKLEPEHPSDYSQHECLAGLKLARRLKLHAGSIVQLKYGAKTESCKLVSILASGGPKMTKHLCRSVVQLVSADAGDRVSDESAVSGTPRR